jgi:hypothetical protein
VSDVIRHTVVFTLAHEPGSAAEQAFLADGARLLARIPGVREFAVSRQVSPKSDFAWQFSMAFADQAAYDAYDAHPVHRAFVAERWQTEVDRFQEFDFVGVVPGERAGTPGASAE